MITFLKAVENLRAAEGVRGVTPAGRVEARRVGSPYPLAWVRWVPSFGGDRELYAWVPGAGWVAASGVV